LEIFDLAIENRAEKMVSTLVYGGYEHVTKESPCGRFFSRMKVMKTRIIVSAVVENGNGEILIGKK
jgi:O-phosphoseryl-tRNA(Cys) synthetase